LSADVVTLWLLNLQSPAAAALAAHDSDLGTSERARLARFLRPQRARQFLLGRLLLRHAACHTLHLDNHQIDILEREGAAPSLIISGATAPPPFHFSLSHSHDWIACASSTSGALGIDIEYLAAARDLTSLANAAFSDEQQAWLSRQPKPQHTAAFYRMWNCMEALYKLGAQYDGTNCRIIDHPQLAICLCSNVALTHIELVEFGQF
jgi:4'-phosphopantetheinyl transferase